MKRGQPPQEKTPKRGKGGPSPSYAQVAKSQDPNEEGDWQEVTRKSIKRKKGKKEKNAKDPVQKAQGIVARPRLKCSSPARLGEVIKVPARNGQSYANILREMKAKVDPWRAGLAVLSIRRTRKEEVLLVLKRGGDVSAFREELDRADGDWADRHLVGSCRLFTRFGGVKTAVTRLAEADATRLLQLGKVKIGWVACHIGEYAEVARCFRCLDCFHGSRGCCNPDRKNACWRCGATGLLARSCKATPRCLTCLDRGDKDFAHVPCSGSCPFFREEFRRLSGRN